MNSLRWVRDLPARHAGTPQVQRRGPGSLHASDRLAKALGWFSFVLAAAGLIGARRIAGRLGLPQAVPFVRAFAAREVVSGVATLAGDPRVGLLSRVGGDVMDLAALGAGLRARRADRDAIGAALIVVGGALLLDALAAGAVHNRRRRRGIPRDYGNRSGFPTSPEQMRGAASEFLIPRDQRLGPPRLAADAGAGRADVRPGL